LILKVYIGFIELATKDQYRYKINKFQSISISKIEIEYTIN